MKISVFIPCIPTHYCLLDRVIDAYIDDVYAVWPEEIVVVISDADKINPEYFNVLRKLYKTCHFNLIVHPVPVPLYTGEACNLVKTLCTGDVIVIQAADDLPHLRRIEVIKKYFSEYDIVSLNHSYWGLPDMQYYGMDRLNKMTEDKLNIKRVIQPHEIKLRVEKFPDDVYGQGFGFKVAAGTVCYRRELADKVTWSSAPKGQYGIFCKEVIKKFNKSIIIDAPVYFYYK